MSRMTAPLVTALGVFLLAGCGGEDGPSREDFAQQVNERTRAVSELFNQNLQRLAPLPADAEIPESSKGRLRELAEAQRQAADEIADLDPPEGAEGATAELIDALREHAGRVEGALRAEELTVDGLTAATSPPPGLTKAVFELREQGIDVVRPLPGG